MRVYTRREYRFTKLAFRERLKLSCGERRDSWFTFLPSLSTYFTEKPNMKRKQKQKQEKEDSRRQKKKKKKKK
tara:strand:- start:6279 stop:6497 length:219 start_codon:yes stop_codon:yes gene_type:complete